MVLETDFLRTHVPTKTKVFLRSLLICGKERPQQVLLKSKMKIVTFHGKTYTNGFPLNGQNERLPNGSQTGHQAV